MPGSAITISGVDLDKAVIFPLPCCSPTDAVIRCAAEHTEVALAHNPVFSTQFIYIYIYIYIYVIPVLYTVRICADLHSCNDRGVFRAPIRTSWAIICSLTRSLWRNDEAGRENGYSMASRCDITNVVGVIACQRGKKYWPCVESLFDWFSMSVGTLT